MFQVQEGWRMGILLFCWKDGTPWTGEGVRDTKGSWKKKLGERSEREDSFAGAASPFVRCEGAGE